MKMKIIDAPGKNGRYSIKKQNGLEERKMHHSSTQCTQVICVPSSI